MPDLIDDRGDKISPRAHGGAGGGIAIESENALADLRHRLFLAEPAISGVNVIDHDGVAGISAGLAEGASGEGILVDDFPDGMGGALAKNISPHIGRRILAQHPEFGHEIGHDLIDHVGLVEEPLLDPVEQCFWRRRFRSSRWMGSSGRALCARCISSIAIFMGV